MGVENVAKIIVKQVPLGNLKSFLGHRPGETAMGDGCGGGCTGGAGCMDPFGLTAITNDEIKAALRDKAALEKALGQQIKAVAGSFIH